MPDDPNRVRERVPRNRARTVRFGEGTDEESIARYVSRRIEDSQVEVGSRVCADISEARMVELLLPLIGSTEPGTG